MKRSIEGHQTNIAARFKRHNLIECTLLSDKSVSGAGRDCVSQLCIKRGCPAQGPITATLQGLYSDSGYSGCWRNGIITRQVIPAFTRTAKRRMILY